MRVHPLRLKLLLCCLEHLLHFEALTDLGAALGTSNRVGLRYIIFD